MGQRPLFIDRYLLENSVEKLFDKSPGVDALLLNAMAIDKLDPDRALQIFVVQILEGILELVASPDGDLPNTPIAMVVLVDDIPEHEEAGLYRQQEGHPLDYFAELVEVLGIGLGAVVVVAGDDDQGGVLESGGFDQFRPENFVVEVAHQLDRVVDGLLGHL